MQDPCFENSQKLPKDDDESNKHSEAQNRKY